MGWFQADAAPALSLCADVASTTPPGVITNLVGAMNPAPNAAPSWNIAPSHQAMAVRHHPKTGERHLDLMTWSFVPRWVELSRNRAQADQCPCRDRGQLSNVPCRLLAQPLPDPCGRVLRVGSNAGWQTALCFCTPRRHPHDVRRNMGSAAGRGGLGRVVI